MTIVVDRIAGVLKTFGVTQGVVLRPMKKLFRESGILVFINNLGYMALLKGVLSYRAIS